MFRLDNQPTIYENGKSKIPLQFVALSRSFRSKSFLLYLHRAGNIRGPVSCSHKNGWTVLGHSFFVYSVNVYTKHFTKIIGR